MSNFTVCRLCLASNIRMHSILNTGLKEIYENLVKTKLSTDERLDTICYLCYPQLQRCRKLLEVAQSSEKMLLQFYHSGFELSENTMLMINHTPIYKLTKTPIENISLKDDVPNDTNNTNTNLDVKCEESDDYVNKIEIDETADIKVDLDQDTGTDNVFDSSDSDDNIPLTAIKVAQTIVTQVKIKKKKRRYQKDMKIDAQEVLLTKQQQIDEVKARANSLNYLNSPFKCHLCYRGFVNCQTYRNHAEKHDESSGAYACDVCSLRYHSARLLRTHAAAAHSRYFKCNKCTHMSHTTNQARDHEKWHEGYTFECQLCGLKFRKRTSYLTHTRKHHPTESVCDLCGYSFVGPNGLLLHKSKSHKRDPQEHESTGSIEDRTCATCDILFTNVEAYQRHLLTSVRHSANCDSTQCVICGERHPDRSSLAEHLKIHKRALLQPRATLTLAAVQAALPCDMCGATFTCRSKLRAHVRRKHLGLKYNKHVVCEVCGNNFTSAASLRYHQRRHTGERPHACALASCGKRFASRNQLRVHARTHSGERPYACRTCAKRFNQKPALNRHLRVHTGAKPYVCQVCSKCFSQSNSLKVHVQAVHLKTPPHRKRIRASDTKTDQSQIEDLNKENGV